MLIAPRIPELARRDRFIRRAVAQRVVHAVSEGGALARVASRCSGTGAGVVLLWSARREAERWSDVLARPPRVTDLSLGALMEHVLPALAADGVAIGPDWTSDTIEPEIGAHDLDGRLRLEMLDLFVLGFQQSGRVWILEGPEGPASMPGRIEGTVSLACWSSAELAAASPAVSAPADAGGPEPMEDLLAALGPRVSGALASLSAPVESPPPQVPTTADRHRADRLWARLRPLSPAARRALVGEGEEFLTWEMAERLSLESEKIADTRAEEALALAELADRIAERASLQPKFGSLLRSLTTASLGHARRSAGLPYADAFRRSDELWRSGAGGDPAELLDGKRRIRLRSAVAAPP